jgi:hypothetical protein
MLSRELGTRLRHRSERDVPADAGPDVTVFVLVAAII